MCEAKKDISAVSLEACINRIKGASWTLNQFGLASDEEGQQLAFLQLSLQLEADAEELDAALTRYLQGLRGEAEQC